MTSHHCLYAPVAGPTVSAFAPEVLSCIVPSPTFYLIIPITIQACYYFSHLKKKKEKLLKWPILGRESGECLLMVGCVCRWLVEGVWGGYSKVQATASTCITVLASALVSSRPALPHCWEIC